MKELLIKQMDFDYWANTELLNSLKQTDPLPERALLLFSHIISANSIWLSRLKEEVSRMNLFQELALPECEQLLIENGTNWSSYLSQVGKDELEKVIKFNFPMDGSIRTISKCDAVFHLTNHSSYHRGQIITLIKGNVKILPALGYVFFASKIV